MNKTLNLGSMALAVFALTSGCITPPEAGGSTDQTFTAVFLEVNSKIVPPVSNTSSIAQPVSINGLGYVADPSIETDPQPTATPGSGGGIAVDPPVPAPSGTPEPGPLPPTYAPSLSVQFSSSAYADDCQAKAVLAAANHLQLTIMGEGTVSRWAAGEAYPGGLESGQPATGQTQPTPISSYGAIVNATKIISCTIESPCVESVANTNGSTTSAPAGVGVYCCPPGAACVLPPSPAPTATPLASN
jgi:hypothetical protein